MSALKKQEIPLDALESNQSTVSVEESRVFLVDFKPDDLENPKNWSRGKRWYLTFAASLIAFNAGVASSAPSGIASNLIEEFNMSEELTVLTISLFVAGYCLGPMLWGPLSEQYGRRAVFLSTLPIYTCFQLGCALAQNRTSIIIFRLLAGIFAAAPFTNSGAIISDIWDAKTRGKANVLFANAPFIGATLGPLIGGYISVSGISWRWLFWVLTIFNGVCIVIVVFTLPETYAPVLLARKAQKIRQDTKDERYYAPIEAAQAISFAGRLKQTLTRPFKMFFQEPMLAATVLYTSFIYGTLYMMFEAFPNVFQGEHGFDAGKLGLTYLPIPIGCVLGSIAYLVIFNPRYEAAVERHKPHPVPPEARLEMTMWSAPMYAIAFFWFGWTSFASVSVWVPLTAALFLGIAAILLFLSLINYTVDVYLYAAASALAANTIIRSIAAGGLPLFATQMYNALDPRWSFTLLGGVSLLMMPIPFVLHRYGPVLRAKSKFAANIYST